MNEANEELKMPGVFLNNIEIVGLSKYILQLKCITVVLLIYYFETFVYL